MHVFKPGDMAIIVRGRPSEKQLDCVGLTCIVESYSYMDPILAITIVDISVAAPGIVHADIRCLKYIPPDEWPEVFTASKPVEVTV